MQSEKRGSPRWVPEGYRSVEDIGEEVLYVQTEPTFLVYFLGTDSPRPLDSSADDSDSK